MSEEVKSADEIKQGDVLIGGYVVTNVTNNDDGTVTINSHQDHLLPWCGGDFTDTRDPRELMIVEKK